MEDIITIQLGTRGMAGDDRRGFGGWRGMSKDIKAGTRVRLKTRTITGWRGAATMLDDDGRAIKDGYSDWRGFIDAGRHEWAVMRDQTPNPEHAGVAGSSWARSSAAADQNRGVF